MIENGPISQEISDLYLLFYKVEKNKSIILKSIFCLKQYILLLNSSKNADLK